MARVICEALIEDGATMKRVLAELSDLYVRPQVFRDYVYVDYQTDQLMKIREVKDVFRDLPNYRIKQTG